MDSVNQWVQKPIQYIDISKDRSNDQRLVTRNAVLRYHSTPSCFYVDDDSLPPLIVCKHDIMILLYPVRLKENQKMMEKNTRRLVSPDL